MKCFSVFSDWVLPRWAGRWGEGKWIALARNHGFIFHRLIWSLFCYLLTLFSSVLECGLGVLWSDLRINQITFVLQEFRKHRESTFTVHFAHSINATLRNGQFELMERWFTRLVKPSYFCGLGTWCRFWFHQQMHREKWTKLTVHFRQAVNVSSHSI